MFKSTTQPLAALQREQGRQDAHIPKNERARQRPIDDALRADLEWQQPKMEIPLFANFLFIIFTTMVATRTPRHSMARSTVVERVTATDSSNATWFLSQISRTGISECRARDGG